MISNINKYYIIPLLPFFFGGIIRLIINNSSDNNFDFSLHEVIKSFDFLKLIFVTGLSCLYLEQFLILTEKEEIIPGDIKESNSKSICRILYIYAFIIWGSLVVCEELNRVESTVLLVSLINMFIVASIIGFAFSLLLFLTIYENQIK